MGFLNLSFERDVVALAQAHAAAIEEAHALGIVLSDALEAAMAIRIMVAIEQGESDIDQLKKWALNEIDASRFPAPNQPAPEHAGEADIPRAN